MIVPIAFMLFLILVAGVLLFGFHMKDREKTNQFRALLSKVASRQGAKIAGGKYFGYPSCEFVHGEGRVTIRREYEEDSSFVSTNIVIGFQKPLERSLMISGRQSPGFKKASALLARVIKPRNDIDIPDLSSEDLKIMGDDPVWAGRILSGDLKKKLINVNKKFLFLRLYAEDKAIICSIRGLPETGEDLEELLDAVLSLYDQASHINNTFGNSPGVEGGIYETYNVGKNLIGGIPVDLVLIGSLYLICGLISTIFFGRLCFESFSRNASGAPFLLLFTLLSIGGSLGGIGVLFLKRWGMIATYDLNLLVVLLYIISKWKDTGLIKSLPPIVSFADSNIFFLLAAPIFFSFWVFNKPETKKLFNRTGSKKIL